MGFCIFSKSLKRISRRLYIHEYTFLLHTLFGSDLRVSDTVSSMPEDKVGNIATKKYIRIYILLYVLCVCVCDMLVNGCHKNA